MPTYPALSLLMVPRDGGNATVILVVQLVLIFGIFYFLLIRPQKKEQERHQAMIDATKKGDEIVTAGGIVGTVVHVDEGRVTIKTAGSTRLELEKARISRVVDPRAEKEEG